MVIISYWSDKLVLSKPIELCGVFESREAYDRFKQREKERGWYVHGGAVLFVDENKTVAQWLEEQRAAGRW